MDGMDGSKTSKNFLENCVIEQNADIPGQYYLPTLNTLTIDNALKILDNPEYASCSSAKAPYPNRVGSIFILLEDKREDEHQWIKRPRFVPKWSKTTFDGGKTYVRVQRAKHPERACRRLTVFRSNKEGFVTSRIFRQYVFDRVFDWRDEDYEPAPKRTRSLGKAENVLAQFLNRDSFLDAEEEQPPQLEPNSFVCKVDPIDDYPDWNMSNPLTQFLNQTQVTNDEYQAREQIQRDIKPPKMSIPVPASCQNPLTMLMGRITDDNGLSLEQETAEMVSLAMKDQHLKVTVATDRLTDASQVSCSLSFEENIRMFARSCVKEPDSTKHESGTFQPQIYIEEAKFEKKWMLTIVTGSLKYFQDTQTNQPAPVVLSLMLHTQEGSSSQHKEHARFLQDQMELFKKEDEEFENRITVTSNNQDVTKTYTFAGFELGVADSPVSRCCRFYAEAYRANIVSSLGNSCVHLLAVIRLLTKERYRHIISSVDGFLTDFICTLPAHLHLSSLGIDLLGILPADLVTAFGEVRLQQMISEIEHYEVTPLNNNRYFVANMQNNQVSQVCTESLLRCKDKECINKTICVHWISVLFYVDSNIRQKILADWRTNST